MDETDEYLNIMDSGGSIIKINGVGNTYPTIDEAKKYARPGDCIYVYPTYQIEDINEG